MEWAVISLNWIKNVFEEILADNFPNLKKKTDVQLQDAQRAPKKMNPNRLIQRHTTIKMAKAKDKEKFLKAAREKQSELEGNPHEAINRILCRNFVGQKGMACYTENPEREIQQPISKIII